MTSSDFQCTVCGYVFEQDGRATQPDRLLSFESLPATWCCTKCGVLKNLFKEITREAPSAVAVQQDGKVE